MRRNEEESGRSWPSHCRVDPPSLRAVVPSSSHQDGPARAVLGTICLDLAREQTPLSSPPPPHLLISTLTSCTLCPCRPSSPCPTSQRNQVTTSMTHSPVRIGPFKAPPPTRLHSLDLPFPAQTKPPSRGTTKPGPPVTPRLTCASRSAPCRASSRSPLPRRPAVHPRQLARRLARPNRRLCPLAPQ